MKRVEVVSLKSGQKGVMTGQKIDGRKFGILWEDGQETTEWVSAYKVVWDYAWNIK
ncbi:hypothetical protein [Streptomyces sp. NPDC018059]|uniref:hypothetical protein n=1 Tax=Streptomyces sp. NPDC018059 TaxID=3365041 RepID=UPI0037AEC179